MKAFASLGCGILFGLGLWLSGMAIPAKVLGFLDVFGDWDPSLGFVLFAAVTVVAVGYRLSAGVRTNEAAFRQRFQPSEVANHRRATDRRRSNLRRGLGDRGLLPRACLVGPRPRRIRYMGFCRGDARRDGARPCPRTATDEERERQGACSMTLFSALRPVVTGFFDAPTNSVSYVVQDPQSRACAVIDAVLDFDYAAGRTGHSAADRIVAFVEAEGLTVEWLIETHVHADHLSASPYLQGKLGGRIGIGAEITRVQDVFGRVFNVGTEFQRDGSQFDQLFNDGDTYSIGQLTASVLHTPGHTPACTTHVIGDAAFVGDTLFMPDGGTARADFPGGDARLLYRSIQRILALPPATRLFMCHDYAPGGREVRWETTVAEERASNIHLHDGIDEETFVALRTARDATLPMPRLMLPAIQVNMNAGSLPAADETGRRYLKVPLNTL